MKPRFTITYHATQQFRIRFPHLFKLDPWLLINEARPATLEEKVSLDIQNINHTGRPINLNGGETLYFLWNDCVFVGKATEPKVVTIQTCWKNLCAAVPPTQDKQGVFGNLNEFYSYLESIKDTPQNFSPNHARHLLVKSGVKTVLIEKLKNKYIGIKYKTFMEKCKKYLNHGEDVQDPQLLRSRESFKKEMEKVKMSALNSVKTETPVLQTAKEAKPRRIKYMVWHEGTKRECWIEAKVNPKDSQGTGWVKIDNRLVRGKILQCPEELKLYFLPN